LALAVGAAADPDVPLPSVTMPLGVAAGVAEVCADTGEAAAIETSTA